MADWEALATGMSYDLWANRLWLECLEQKGGGEPDRSILGHMLSAQQVWLTRCHGESLGHMPQVEPTEEAMVALASQWRELLLSTQADRVVDFRRTTGEQLRLPLSVIVTHVINHGTYHRGELRGLCLARGDNDFPETDFGRFVMEKLPDPVD